MKIKFYIHVLLFFSVTSLHASFLDGIQESLKQGYDEVQKSVQKGIEQIGDTQKTPAASKEIEKSGGSSSFMSMVDKFSFSIPGATDKIFVFLPAQSDSTIEWKDILVHDTILRTVDDISGFQNVYVENYFDAEKIENSISYSQLSRYSDEQKKQFIKNKNIDLYIQWSSKKVIGDKKEITMALNNNGKVIKKIDIEVSNYLDLGPVRDAVIDLLSDQKKLDEKTILAIKQKHAFQKTYASIYYAQGFSGYIKTYDILVDSGHKAMQDSQNSKQKIKAQSKNIKSLADLQQMMQTFEKSVGDFSKTASSITRYENKRYMLEGIDLFKKSLDIEESAQAHIALANIMYVGNSLLKSFPPKEYLLEHCSKGSSINSKMMCINGIKDAESMKTNTASKNDSQKYYQNTFNEIRNNVNNMPNGMNLLIAYQKYLSLFEDGYLYLDYSDVKNLTDKMMGNLFKIYDEKDANLQSIYLSIGKIEYYYNKYDIAEVYLRKVLSATIESQVKKSGSSFGQMAEINKLLNAKIIAQDSDVSRAIKSNYEQSKNEQVSAAYLYLTKVYIKQGLYEKTNETIPHVTEHIDKYSRRDQILIYETLGDLTANKEPVKALEYYSKADSLNEKFQDVWMANTQTSKLKKKYATLLYVNKKFNDAYNKSIEAYKILLEYQLSLANIVSNENLATLKQEIMDVMIESAVNSSVDNKQLYEILAMNKNQAIVSNVQAFDLIKNNHSIDAIINNIRKNKQELLTLKDSSKIEILKKSIDEYENQLYSLTRMVNFISMSELPKIPNNTTVIDFYSGKDNYYAFVIDGTKSKVVKVGEKNILDSKIQNNKLSYEDIWKNFNISSANIIIIPTGLFYNVSFEKLKSNKEYLIEKYNISYLNSIAMLQNNERYNLDHPVTFFANPNFDLKQQESSNEFRGLSGAHFNSLPGTGLEVSKITDILKKSNKIYEVFDGANANEKNFMNEDFNGILHLATHGFFSASEEGFSTSGIVLSGANQAIVNHKDYGIITGKKILTKDFSKVDLVVLSACDTGKGTVSSTKGVESLGTAFSLAGAKRTIISLQKVPDLDTSLLMKEFYKNLYIEKQSFHDAFRNAKITLLRKGYGPDSWGSFIIFG